VIERRYGNAVEQDVYLHNSAFTPGQNFIRAVLYGPMGAGLNQKRASYVAVRAADMMVEARRAIPAVRLTQSPYFLQNNYGPFGYAFGHGRGDDACLYAWQQIRPPEGRRSPLRDYGTIQVRIRYCKAGARESELLALVYGYTISGTFGAPDWNPYGAPPAVEAALGRTGSPIHRKEMPGLEVEAAGVRRAEPNVRVEKARAKTPELTPQAVAPATPVPQATDGLPSPTTAAGTAGVVVPLPTCAPQGDTACP
jgi:hypothetical protein